MGTFTSAAMPMPQPTASITLCIVLLCTRRKCQAYDMMKIVCAYIGGMQRA